MEIKVDRNVEDYLWWRDGVIYHAYLRSFADSNGDGLGDLPGLIAHLDHLKGSPDSLDVDAIWISPFYPSPDKDFGYDVANYCDIDPRYGSLADFDRLIHEAHKRDLRVILDLVFNHTSDQHPWFLQSRSSRDNPKRDWYIWRDPRPGNRPPNNWQSVFGGKAWEWDDQTQQYYLHLFLKEQPDLNWRNPEVRNALMKAVRFWLDRGTDGFRLDVFNLWFKHPDLPDNPRCLGIRPFERQRHIYDADQPEMRPALAEFRSILDDYSERTSVGEPAGRGHQPISSYCGQDQLHMIFNFKFSFCHWSPTAFLNVVRRWEQSLSNNCWPCFVLSNHDLSRHVTRYGGRNPDAIAKVAAALLLTLRGTPFLYYGEEIAMPNTRLRRNQIVDPPGIYYWPIYKGRDPARGPMQWDASIHAGFTTSTPWLPTHPDYRKQNVAAQLEDPYSVLNFYRSLIRLRRNSDALRKGSFRTLTKTSRQILSFIRETPQQQALVALNFTGRPAHLQLDDMLHSRNWDLALSSSPQAASPRGREIKLGPYEASIFLSVN
jgi:alpha-glucosidase